MKCYLPDQKFMPTIFPLWPVRSNSQNFWALTPPLIGGHSLPLPLVFLFISPPSPHLHAHKGGRVLLFGQVSIQVWDQGAAPGRDFWSDEMLTFTAVLNAIMVRKKSFQSPGSGTNTVFSFIPPSQMSETSQLPQMHQISIYQWLMLGLCHVRLSGRTGWHFSRQFQGSHSFSGRPTTKISEKVLNENTTFMFLATTFYNKPTMTWTQHQSTSWHLPKEDQSNPDRFIWVRRSRLLLNCLCTEWFVTLDWTQCHTAHTINYDQHL